MVRMALSTQLAYEIFDTGCDFIFNIQAAFTPRQRVVEELLSFNQTLTATYYTDAQTQSRFIALRATQGPLTVYYSAVVDLTHFEAAPNDLFEVSPQALPGHVLPYLYPSRYCQSDRLLTFAAQHFGNLPMGRRRRTCAPCRPHAGRACRRLPGFCTPHDCAVPRRKPPSPHGQRYGLWR